MRYYITDADYEKAKANGIYREAVYSRVYSLGWTIEKAITDPIRKSAWRQWREVATANGINQGTFNDRVQAGLSHEQAATRSKRSRK